MWASVIKPVPKMDKSGSGQMVSKKVKLTYFNNSMKGLKQPTLVFLQGDLDDVLELFAKNKKNKGGKGVVLRCYSFREPILIIVAVFCFVTPLFW